MVGAARPWQLLRVIACLLLEVQASVPVQAALGVHISDSDPQKGVIAGNISIRSPPHDPHGPGIDFFSVYWGSDASTPLSATPLVVVPTSGDASTRPTCMNDCNVILMTATADGWSINRTGGYRNSEYASIVLQGPGTVTLTYLDIERGWDTLCLDGYCFERFDVGSARSFTSMATLVWSSDSSVTYDGWAVTYTGEQASHSVVYTSTVPTSSIPTGATHYLVYSGNANGEMAAPAATEIQDVVALPTPTAISFTDTSPTPGHIAGLLTVTAPQDADVTRIDVYLGAPGTVRLGVCAGLVGYRFDPGLGVNMDCSLNGNHLQPIAAELVSGPMGIDGHGLRFDGTFAAVMRFPAFSWAHGGLGEIQGTGWTAAAWVQPSVAQPETVRLLGRGEAAGMSGMSSGDIFAMQLTPEFLVRCAAMDDIALGPVSCTTSAAHALPQNTWTHVVCQHETHWMVAMTGTMRIFIDGVLVKSCTTGGPYWMTPSDTFTIGGDPVSEVYFDGSLDDVAVFQEILTAEEIQLLRTGYRLASWPAGDATYSIQLDTAVPANATTLHAVAVGRWNEGVPFIADLVDDAVPTHPPLGVSFTDADPMAGSYGGVVVVQRAADESDLSHYIAYWGTSAAEKIPGSLAIGSVGVMANGTSSANFTASLPIHLPNGQLPPAGASHIVVVSAIQLGAASGEMSTGVGVALQDYAPPSVEAQAVTFTDTDPTTGVVSGDIVVTRATDETGVVSYNLYWADSQNTKLFLITKLATSGSMTFTVSNAALPVGATRILVVVEGAGGEAPSGPVTSGEVDYTTLTAPRDLAFQDTDPGVDVYGGSITFRRAVREETVQQYEVYWAQLSGATASPLQLIETITTASNNESLSFQMIDSYGDGWNGAVYRIQDLTGALVAEGTFESGYGATHTIHPVTAGASLLLTVTEGNWPSEMSWVLWSSSGQEILSSASGTFPVNYQFRVPGTASSNSGNVHVDGDMIYVTLPSGAAPTGADQILAQSRLNSGSTSVPLWVALSDFAPPSTYPTSIQFQDTDAGAATIAGVITIGRAADESSILGYKVYFGSSATEKLPPPALPGLHYKLFVFPQGSSVPSLDGRVPTSEGIHPALDFERKDFGAPGAFATGFAIRWTGFLHIAIPGTYYFQAFADGCKVYLHGDVLIDDEFIGTNASWSSGASTFLAQGKHALQVDYAFPWAPATPEGTMVLYYWGADSNDMWMKVPAAKLSYGVNETDWVAFVSVSEQGDPLVVDLPSTPLPENASHLLAFGSSSTGDSYQFAATPVVDLVLPMALASNVSFVDSDPAVGQYAGPVTFTRGQDEDTITQYLLYWGQSETIPALHLGPLASVYVDPSFTCTPFVGYFTGAMPLTSTWTFVANAYALDSPEVVAFQQGCQQHCLTMPSCSGFAMYVYTDSQSGCEYYGVDIGMGFVQNVSYGGLSTLCQKTSILGSYGTLQLPASAAPSGMTHLVVVSAYENVTMSSGAGVVLTDYSTVDTVATNLSFEDMNPLAGFVEGTVMVGAAADESQISGYAIYWGQSSSMKLEGGEPGLQAQFYAMPSCPCMTCNVDFASLGAPILVQDEAANMYSFSRPGGALSAWPGLNRSEFFAARWQGRVTLAGGHYTMTLVSDDGARILINGAQALSTTGTTGATTASGDMYMPAGTHDVELEYYQCRGSSGVTVAVSGPDTGYMDVSLWTVARHGPLQRPPLLTLSKTGSDLTGTIPSDTMVPVGATHLLAFAQSLTGYDSTSWIAVALQDLIRPNGTAQALNFTDMNPAPNFIEGVLVIKRAVAEQEVNFYNVYWGSSATEIVNVTSRSVGSLSDTRPTCSGASCGEIAIAADGSSSQWSVTRTAYSNYESASITLVGPAEVRFTYLHTERCCDKIQLLDTFYSGFTTPSDTIVLPEGVHVATWNSDFSVTNNGWSFIYTYQGLSDGRPGLIASLPKPEGQQDLALPITPQALLGTHFIVKTAYNLTESSGSVALEIQDLAPNVIPIHSASFTDVDLGSGVIGGNISISAAASVTGFRVYWGRNSTHPIAGGIPGLLAEYFYLSPTSYYDAIPHLDSMQPDLVQVESMLYHPETNEAFPGVGVSDAFAARWTGYIMISSGGSYLFTLNSDDGSKLYVNGVLVVDNDGVHGMQAISGDAYLYPGMHAVKVDYFDQESYAGIMLSYSGPDTGGATVAVPGSVLRHGSLDNALVGECVAQAGACTVQVVNATIPSEASHLLVRAYDSEGESTTGASLAVEDAALPSQPATGIYFQDVDPVAGQVSGTITLEPAEDPSQISHYVIYWGSSATVKLDGVPIAQIAANASGTSRGSCGVKGPDDTPLRFTRNGINGPKIVNGQDASRCEWRWQVSLRSQGWHFCGGTLISPKWVMTAAHCVEGGGGFQVVTGDFDKDSDLDASEETHQVLRVISHELYNSNTMTHDFALIELDAEVDTTACAASACLPDAEVPAGQECFITGWGTLASGGSSPSILQEGMVLALTNSECNARYAGQILDDMLCAQGTASGGIVDACQGDSGGPLVCPTGDGRYVLHGATSWGYGCADADYPGVWSRITSILGWIETHTGLTPQTGGGGNVTYNLTAQAIPAGATHLLVFSSKHGAEMSTGISVPVVDFAPTSLAPASISFTDTDPSPGELGGTIVIGRAADETNVTHYAVYWGSSDQTVLEIFAQVPKGSGSLEIPVPANTPQPSGASHFLAFVVGPSGQGSNSAAVAIVDVDHSRAPGGLAFQDADPGQGTVGGTVTIQRAASQTGVTAYNLYWSTGSCTTLGGQIASVTVARTSIAPYCFTGNACSDINVLQEDVGVYVVSRGMDGYRNDERASLYLEGPGVIRFSRFGTEAGYDTLTIDGMALSGSSVPADVQLGAGQKQVDWFSDFSVTGAGWVFTYESRGNFGDATYELPYGTFLPSSATEMMVFSVSEGSEYRGACAATAVSDFAPPSQIPQALWFQDSDSASGLVGGDLIILQSRNHSSLEAYHVYWGANSTHRLPGVAMVAAVPATTAGTNVTVTIASGTPLPVNATTLLVFASSSSGESRTAASVEVVDYEPAQDAATSIAFVDVDEGEGVVAGMAYIGRAADESSVDFYNLYFSLGTQKLDFIGSVPAPTLAARPSCSGTSCTQIEIRSVAGGIAYEVSRGTSYDNNEQASIAVTGPGMIKFTFFTTEAGYDFLTILGTAYSGNSMPGDIDIPAGTHEIVWRSDGSVTTGGWIFRLESGASDSLSVEVPRGTSIPDTADSLLVLTASAGGEMATGITAPLVDYHPPSAIAVSVQCQDTNPSIGVFSGFCDVRRAAVEVGVLAYDIYWGRNASHPIPGSPAIGQAVLNASAGALVTASIASVPIHSSASHLVALAVGSGGAAGMGVGTPVLDNSGLSLDPSSLNLVATPGSTVSSVVTITSDGSEDITLQVGLVFEDDSAQGALPASLTSTPSTGSGNAGAGYILPSVCETVSDLPVPGKKRLLYKMKKAKQLDPRARRLHAKGVETKHGVKITTFDRLGGIAFAEMKNASTKQYCQMFVDLENDPVVQFVEEDLTWFALGKPKMDDMLFPPPKPQPEAGGKLKGRMHRRTDSCSTCRDAAQGHPNDVSFEDLWGLHQDNDVDIDAPEAWAIHQGTNGRVVIAVLDTGVDYNHEDLRNQMWVNPGEIAGDGIDNDGNGFVDDVYGYDFYGDSGDPMDSNGHGTHCAGTIGAEAGNSIGVAGVSWKPQIMALKFLGASGGSTGDAIRALDYAVMMGAQISSNSWGGGGYSQALVDAIDEAATYNHLFIVAAGNDGRDNEISATYPCNYNRPNMICVASTDSANDISSFSNWGTEVVHIAAPGSRIYSTYPNNQYEFLSGTSMATPHVSGVAALVLDYVDTLTYAELRNLILTSGVSYAKFEAKVSTGKLLNAHAALQMAGQYAWARVTGPAASGSITVPAGGSASVDLELGNARLEEGEYRVALRIWKQVNDILYSRLVPVIFTLHRFGSAPTVGAGGIEFEDTDARRDVIAGALTITRATPEQEDTFSQYHIFWADSTQLRTSETPLATLDTGNVLQDNFAFFDNSFWFPPDADTAGESWSVSSGAAIFSGQYDTSHLTMARRFAPPFTMKAKVRKTAGALAHMVIQVGGESVSLFGSGGLRAMMLGSQKILVSPDGQHYSVPCTLGTWFEVTITVLASSVTFADNQGCQEIVQSIPSTDETKAIRIGADCTGDCQGSVWDSFEVSGGLYATFNVPPSTSIPSNAAGFVVHAWNVLGLQTTGLYMPLVDHRVAVRAAQPTQVTAGSATTSSLSLSWTRGALNDCSSGFERYEVMAQGSAGGWVEPAGCTMLVNVNMESCTATQLASDMPYQFRVRVLCVLEETQSLWSEISEAAMTLPMPAVAPSSVRSRVPSSTGLLVSWETGTLNDCEFSETVVEGQPSGGEWFQPEGCTGLTMLNTYTCTAEALTSGTEYVFRVKTNCADSLSSSPYSAVSLPVATLATAQTWETEQRRVLSVSMTSNIDYNQVQSNPELQNALVSNIVAATATRMGVDPSRVRVEVLAGTALPSSRRLSALSTVFSVVVDGVSEDTSTKDITENVAADVSTAVEVETGTASEVQVSSVNRLVAAVPPERVTWTMLSPDSVQLHWNVRPLNDCSFLAWQVHARAGSIELTPPGCQGLVNLSSTSCIANGFATGNTYTFSVTLLCADPAISSEPSEASEPWMVGSVPTLVSAEFTAGYSTLLLTFDVVVTAELLTPTSCADAFSAVLGQKFGSEFSCNVAGSQLAVTLGSGATLVLGDSISLVTAAGLVAVTSSLPVVEVSGFLSASPPAVLPCVPVTLLLQASGSAGRALQLEWSTSSQSPSLASVLAAATADSSTSVELSPAVLASVLSAAQVQDGQGLDLDVSVQVTNWLGDSSMMSTSVKLLSDGQPTASIMAVGPTTLTRSLDEDVELEVATGIVAPCNQSEEVTGTPVTTWHYKASNSWTTLTEAGLMDASPLPNRVRVAAFGLAPGVHEFRATASLSSEAQGAQEVVFHVTVVDIPPPTLEVTGPRSVGVGCDLQLATSWTGVVHPSATIVYAWTCHQPSSCNSTISNFASGGAGSTEAGLQLSGSELALGSYRFRVTMTQYIPGHFTIFSVAEVTIAVQSGGPLPVQIATPWSRMDRISLQAPELKVPIVAAVGSEGGCQVPSGAAFKWVLAKEEAPQQIVSVLDSTTTAGVSLAVSTTDFTSTALVPSTTYVYALLSAANASHLALGEQSGSLQDAAIYGLSVTLSLPFVADAPPSSGRAVVSPEIGEALKSKFRLATEEWSDEDASTLDYAFYIFPLGDTYTVSEGSEGTLQSTPTLEMPTIEWSDPSSPQYWTKFSGLLISVWGSSASISGLDLASGTYYTVARARDHLGGVASTAVLGPWVRQPSTLSTADLTNALAAVQQSSDPNKILSSLNAVTEMSGAVNDTSAEAKREVTNLALSALESVTSIVEATEESLQQLGESVKKVVVSTGGAADESALTRAADVLGSCLDLALNASETGVSSSAGTSILASIVTIGKSSGDALEDDGVQSVSSKLVSLISDLGQAASKSLEAGELQELNSVDETTGEGVKLAVSKESASEATSSGVQLKQLSISASALAGRRLQQTCDSIELQSTEWLKSNPHSYARSVRGGNGTVPEDADVLNVEIRFCGRSVLNELADVRLPIPSFPAAPEGFVNKPTCARYDKQQATWTVENAVTAPADGGMVRCSSTFTSVSYVVFAEHIAVATATTETVTITTPTSTTTSVSGVIDETSLTLTPSNAALRVVVSFLMSFVMFLAI